MENLAEALKMGFAIALFVMALSLSMSSFSQATEAVNAVISARDRDKLLEDATIEELKEAGYEQYVYVEPAPKRTRMVGIESVVSTINRSIQENIEIHILEANADGSTTPYEIHTITDNSHVIDLTTLSSSGEDGIGMHIEEFVKILLGGPDINPENCGITFSAEEWNNFKDKCVNKLVYPINTDGLYDELKDCEFEEVLGEYHLGTGTSEYKKVVITYIIQP